MTNLSWIDLGVLATLTLAVTWIGHRLGGAIQSRESFFTADGGLPWWAVSSSIVATVVSSVTFISVPAAVFRDGGNITYIQIIIGLMLGKLLTAWLFAKPYYLSRSATTTYDYIGQRLDSLVGNFSMVLGLGLTTINTAVKLLTSALVLTVITDWNLAICTAIIVVFSVLWSWLAGLKTVVWTDFLLFVLFAAGAVFAVIWIALGLGLSFSTAWKILDDNAKLILFDFSTNPQVTYTIWAGLAGSLTLSLALATSQGTMQRIRACRSIAEAKKAYNMSALFYFMHFCIIGVGLALWLHYQQTPLPLEIQTQLTTEPDRIFPFFIMTEIPTGLSGFFIAAIFAAGISTLDSAITEVSDISINNIYTRYLKRDASENHYLWAAKLSLCLWGFIFFLLAMFFSQFQAEGLLNLTFKLPSYLFGALFATAILARYRIGSFKSFLPGLIIACLAVWWLSANNVGFFWWCPVSGGLMIATTATLEYFYGDWNPETTGVISN